MDSIKPQESTKPKLGTSDTFYKSKSYQSMTVMNGSGTPVSEKKMSAFSVEEHNGSNGQVVKLKQITFITNSFFSLILTTFDLIFHVF